MRAVTICQPYAELIARGEKLVENRRWQAAYRGLLAIHAGKSRDWLTSAIPEGDLVFGAIIAYGFLERCFKADHLPVDDALFGHEHIEGPWCWDIREVKRITPLAYRGQQGLWRLPTELGEAIASGQYDLEGIV
jgi:hypothetical protein